VIRAKKWCYKAYAKKDQMTRSDEAKQFHLVLVILKPHREKLKQLDNFLKLMNQVPLSYYDLGYSYSCLHQYDKAIPEFEKALEIYNNGIQNLFGFRIIQLLEEHIMKRANT